MDTKQALYTFGTGENFHLQHYLGAHKEQVDGVEGYSFRVWAPNAQAVHLVGDFTQWEENEIPMVRNEAGVWEVFTTAPQVGDIYKFHVTRQNGHRLMKKLDTAKMEEYANRALTECSTMEEVLELQKEYVNVD